MFQQEKPILLASGSPRRREYLERYGLEFEVRTAQIDETPLPGEDPITYVRRMVVGKAEPFAQKASNGSLVITADTLVLLHGEIIGKPEGAGAVLPMLKKLNGQAHQVITGYGFWLGERRLVREVASRVYFRKSSDALLAAYAREKEPLDKAGAYSIQGLGTCLVESIEGSYNNVVGLPIEELLADLITWGVIRPVL
ncbi:MAG: nucleoside triphosphate pyrophosphatase [bacterium]|nr:nucleoside triphosphate pyrophosphatase [bacterium]